MRRGRLRLGDAQGREVLVVGLGEVHHHVLCALRQLSDPASRGSCIPCECWYNSFWWKNSSVLDHAAVFENTTPADHNILANVHIRVDIRGIDNCAITNEHVVTNLQWEERNSLAEFLERRPDDRFCANDAVAADSHVGQIPADDRLRLHNVLSVQDYILRSTEDRLSANAVSGRLKKTNLCRTE